ncbi:YidC/Oxa1 family membrane protein insertase [Streptomyces sp. NBC_00704]|uniref:YidC/Oxa1 family membrane protein insertase n=1 Tax=Streptomyces sp. NBC_00704 TaxID=2975809 RepID=UPI002E37D392|nr:YidC/Oxa1 family membrane protein insertase [Streptomyces sp. NBC_00704]
MSVLAGLVEHLADLLQPLCGTASAAAAIVLFTASVRLLVHPLSRAAARGQKARAALQPRIAELREKHGENPEKLQRAVLDLHAAEKVSPLSGCLPSLLQLPAFFLLYRLFSGSSADGAGRALLDHHLFTAPLGDRWTDALAHGGPFGEAGLVYFVLFAVVTAVASFNYLRARRTPPPVTGGQETPGVGALTKAMPFMSFFTLVTMAVVPLAAALYVITSTTWSAVERAVLHR